MSGETNNMDQLLDTIQNLQNTEQTLYNSLQNIDSENIGTQTTTTLNKIDNLTQTRINLFKHIQSNLQNLQDSVNKKENNLTKLQDELIQKEAQLNNSKNIINNTKNKKINKLRLVEINTFYGQKYKASIELVKIIILALVPLILGILIMHLECSIIVKLYLI